MPRPCETAHEAQPATCRLCYLWQTDPRYRQLWGGNPDEVEQEPGLLGKLTHFGQSLVRHAQNRFQKASKEEVERRLAICRTCNYLREDTCTKCGCGLGGSKILNKTVWQSEKCPVGLW